MEAGSVGFLATKSLPLNPALHLGRYRSPPTTPCKCGVRWWVLGRLPNSAVTTTLIKFTPLTAESHVKCWMLHGGLSCGSKDPVGSRNCSLVRAARCCGCRGGERLELQLLQHSRTTQWCRGSPPRPSLTHYTAPWRLLKVLYCLPVCSGDTTSKQLETMPRLGSSRPTESCRSLL